MRVIKCGGNILKHKEFRKSLYDKIKNSDEKILLVVSAFKDSPYSTMSLQNLISNNYSYYMKEELISIGEIISSIIITNELLNEYIDAELIYKEEIGINVYTTDKMEEIKQLDYSIIKDKIEKHKVVVIPGFIGINQDNKIVTLNKNGSDLTAVLIAKMFNLNKVYLYKDVLGLSSIDPNFSTNYKIYKTVSFSLMQQIVMHGSNLIQQEAIRIAKENNIEIDFIYYLNESYKTNVSKVSSDKVIVLQEHEKNLYIDGYVNKEQIEKLLLENNIDYDYILPCESYIKIVSSHNNQKTILNILHNNYLKGNL